MHSNINKQLWFNSNFHLVFNESDSILKNKMTSYSKTAQFFKPSAILFLGSLLLFATMGLSQSYYVQTYNENDGLSSSMVYDVTQDSTGRMWFATRGGISVYDAALWKHFSVVDGLPVTSYSKLKVDEKGIVWALSDAPGLYVSYFTKNRWQTLHPPNLSANISNFSSFEVTYINQELNIFIGTGNTGLFQFTGNNWKQITPKQGLADYRINGIITLNEVVYVATDNGLSIIKDNKIDNSLMGALNLPSSQIIGIALERKEKSFLNNNRIWLQGKNWVGFIEEKTFKLVSDNVKPNFGNIYHYFVLCPDYNNGTYLGNVYDVFYVDSKNHQVERFSRKSGLITEGATSLFLDREKKIWISSLRGVSKINSRRFANYNKGHGLLENEVTAILEIEPGELVLGHENGLTYFDDANFRTLTLSDNKYESEVKTRVLDLAIDSSKNMLVAASALGLAKINKNGVIKWYRKNEGIKDAVTSVLVDRSNRIWVTDRKNLYIFKGEKFISIDDHKIFEKDKQKVRLLMRKIFPGPENTIYIATAGGGIYVYRPDTKTWNQYLSHKENYANSVYSVFTDSQGRYFVGSLAGLYKLYNNELVKYSSNGFRINRPVYLIIEDKKKRLWFGTDNGVIRWDGDHVREYTIEHGFGGQETNRAAGIVDYAGRVWIGTDLGVSCYNEDFDYQPQDVVPPLVEFLYLDASGEKKSLYKANKLNYRQNNLTFCFRGLSFIDEKSIRYKFKLKGYEKSWSFQEQTENPQVRYINLSPGSYFFQLQARNALGKWSNVISSEGIIIRSPFWQTTYFRVIAVLCVLGIFAFFYYRRISGLKRERNAQQFFSKQLIETQERDRKRIAGELHDSLGQNLLIIKNGIEQYINSLIKKTESTDELSELASVALDSINEVREISYNLHPHQLDKLGLKKAIMSGINKFAQSSNIEFITELAKINNLFPKEMEIHIFRIVQEALNNIVKHAAATEVIIHIKKTKKYLNIIIRDNGIGFDFKKHISDSKNVRGFGLTGIVERVKILKGYLVIDSEPRKGTALKIALPLKRL